MNHHDFADKISEFQHTVKNLAEGCEELMYRLQRLDEDMETALFGTSGLPD